ncbi:hypothetical protein B0G81_6796 [Paraburkholderia sp. BL6665CI2N2]|nr:hypothetical protein B0G81_6796 [Paraburkholderia sp. BL6665CI2N2]
MQKARWVRAGFAFSMDVRNVPQKEHMAMDHEPSTIFWLAPCADIQLVTTLCYLPIQ